MSSRVAYYVAAWFLGMILGCDQGSRYEMSKDGSGRTLRLDKKTGEIAVVDAKGIVPLTQLKSSEDEEAQLASTKKWPANSISRLGLAMMLETSWSAGRLYYSLDAKPLDKNGKELEGEWERAQAIDPKESEKADDKKFDLSTAKPGEQKSRKGDLARLRFSGLDLILDSGSFELLRTSVRFSAVVDEAGNTAYLQARGNVAMPKEAYRRVDSWNFASPVLAK
jgi:hypothetical protein